MSTDYFQKAAKRTQPIRDAFSRPSQVTAPKAPSTPKAPTVPAGVKVGELQGETLEDYDYMRGAQEKLNRKLAPKSVMSKSNHKR